MLSAQIKKIYFWLISHGLFPEEQKGCRKGIRRLGGLLFIDQHIIMDSQTRRKNVDMAWIDNKQIYDMVTQSLIINYRKMYKIAHEVIKFNEYTMKKWRVELKAGGRKLHHHHVVLVARISLTLSRHFSLWFIASGRSSGQHPVSSHSCWMYIRAGRPACISREIFQGDALSPLLFVMKMMLLNHILTKCNQKS